MLVAIFEWEGSSSLHGSSEASCYILHLVSSHCCAVSTTLPGLWGASKPPRPQDRLAVI